MYVLIRGVVAKWTVLVSSSSSTSADRAVGDHRPVRRSGDVQAEVALMSGWSKQAYIRLESVVSNWRVQVDLVVDRIDEAVQALPDGGVQQVGVDDSTLCSARSASTMPCSGS